MDKSIYNLVNPRKIFHTTVIQVCSNATVKLSDQISNINDRRGARGAPLGTGGDREGKIPPIFLFCLFTDMLCSI